MNRLWAFVFFLCFIMAGCGGSGSSVGNHSPVNDKGGEPTIDERKAVLTWSPPLKRENGEALSLSAIDRYEVVHRFKSEETLYSIEYPGTQFVMKGLSEGTHYFTVSVYDDEGRKSKPSEEVFKTIL